MPADAQTEQTQSVIDKIARLLALAERAGTQHEAETALAKAQALMERHSIQMEQVRAAEAVYQTDFVQEGGRRLIECRFVGTVLMQHFFVRLLVARPGGCGSYVMLFGRPEHVALGRYVYVFLIRTFRQLWREHQRATGQSRKHQTTYYAGLSQGLNRKLEREKAARNTPADTAALVRIDAGLVRAMRAEFPGCEQRSISSTPVSGDGGAFRSGCRDGEQITIHKPLPAPAAVRRIE